MRTRDTSLRRGAAAVAAVISLAGASPAAAAPGDRVTIAWGGDLTLGSSYGLPPARGWPQLAPVARVLRSADLAAVNYEGTFGSGGTSKCGGAERWQLLRVPGAGGQRADAGAGRDRCRQPGQQPCVRLRPGRYRARPARRSQPPACARPGPGRDPDPACERHARRVRRLLHLHLDRVDERRPSGGVAGARGGAAGRSRGGVLPRRRGGRRQGPRAAGPRARVRGGPRRQPPLRPPRDRRGRRRRAGLRPPRAARHGALPAPPDRVLARQPVGLEELRHRRDAAPTARCSRSIWRPTAGSPAAGSPRCGSIASGSRTATRRAAPSG